MPDITLCRASQCDLLIRHTCLRHRAQASEYQVWADLSDPLPDGSKLCADGIEMHISIEGRAVLSVETAESQRAVALRVVGTVRP
jgi:hypothetical protein